MHDEVFNFKVKGHPLMPVSKENIAGRRTIIEEPKVIQRKLKPAGNCEPFGLLF